MSGGRQAARDRRWSGVAPTARRAGADERRRGVGGRSVCARCPRDERVHPRLPHHSPRREPLARRSGDSVCLRSAAGLADPSPPAGGPCPISAHPSPRLSTGAGARWNGARPADSRSRSGLGHSGSLRTRSRASSAEA